MHSEYQVDYNGQQVGTAWIHTNGLYYKIRAVCRLRENKMLRLQLHCDDAAIDLGLMVPEENCFALCKDIPKKKLPVGEIRFYLHGNKAHMIPFQADRPFLYLSILDRAKLIIHTAMKYIDCSIHDYNSNKTGQ